MTVILGYRNKNNVYIGADSQGSSGWDSRNRADPKVFKAHGILYGFTSSYRMGQILRFHSEEVSCFSRGGDVYKYVVTKLVPMWRRILGEHGFKSTDNSVEKGGTFIIGIDGHIFSIQDDFQVAQHEEDYCSVGCGFSYALGAMSILDTLDLTPEEKIKKAISSTINFSNGCGGKINIVSSVEK